MAGAKVVLSYNGGKYKDVLDELDDMTSKVQRKMVQVGKRIAKETRTDISKRIREIWNIKKKDLDKGLTIIREKVAGTFDSFGVKISGSPINLREFDAVGVRRTGRGTQVDKKDRSTIQKRSKRGTGITALIKKGEGRTNLPSSFFATVRTGSGFSTRVFRRNQSNNLEAVNVITIASMFDQLGIREPTIERALKRFDEEIKRIQFLDI